MKALISLLCWTGALTLGLIASAQNARPPAAEPSRATNAPPVERAEPPAPADAPAPQPPDQVEPPNPTPVPPPEAEPAAEPMADRPTGAGPGAAPGTAPDSQTSPGAAPATVPAPASERTPLTPATRPAATNEPGSAATSAEGAPTLVVPPTPTKVVADGERGIMLNFRNAPLEMVLNYLSEAAGFIIDLQTDVKGKVDVWSNQPLTKEEAVDVPNAVLGRNGYVAIRNGRMLSIVSKDGAQKKDLPVVSGSDPTKIPKSEEMVTQIIPVRFINATTLVKDLQPLLPTATTMTANEGGNALVITDTQVNIRRMAEIVKALDTAISATSSIRVFPLKFADAKALATVITALFPSQDATGRGNNPMQMFFRGMRGGQDPAAAASSGSGRVATPRVVATSDDRSNSLVVSAPEDQMAIIADLVSQVDTNVDDVTELRVFHLKNADPEETADLLASLFPDPTSSQNTRGQMQFGRFGGGPFGQQQNTQSSRLVKQARVIAVPDTRTGSVVVSASRELMDQIIPVVDALDSDPRRKQKVFVYDVENTDPQTMQSILQNLFPSQTYGNNAYNRNSSQQVGNQLNNRATSSSQYRSTSSTQNRSSTSSSSTFSR